MSDSYQAVLVLSFGGPEKHDDVIPFLENVLRGKNVPRERMLEVAEHYYHFDGRSPINDQNRELISALSRELETHGPNLPVYWGNRNWHPLLPNTLRQIAADGITKVLVYVTSAFSSYSGCRQYREDMDRAKLEAGTPQLQLDKLRAFHDNPEFIACLSERVSDALNQIPEERRASAGLIFTAHSIPMVMANSSPYVAQLTKACEAVAGSLGRSDWRLVYQSRSGPPSQPWLEPDIGDALREFAAARGKGAAVVVSPVGFVSDHMEVLYDLDTEASQLCLELGIHMVRALTPGVHPRFVSMIRGLIAEAVAGSEAVMADCAVDCCPPPPRRPAGPPAGSRPE